MSHTPGPPESVPSVPKRLLKSLPCRARLQVEGANVEPETKPSWGQLKIALRLWTKAENL